MFGISGYGIYLLTSLLLNVTPGTDTMYIISRSTSQGRKAGYYSVLGISTGAFIHTLLSAFGLSIILAKSIVLFTAIKLIGAAYLIYLGIRMLRQKSPLNFESSALQNMELKKIYMQGVLTNVTNPKVALFFISFLPQFIRPDNPYGPVPFILLGISFIMTGTIWCFIIAYFASFATKKLRENAKIADLLNKLTGIVFIGLGIKLFQTKASRS
ncbi:LysE family translocator [Bacillus smithii]|uniref:Homoserine/Threonine efflux protein n=1 Tax=Bacillus smithii 7_3_47FAA TaxID=665952 RepID=G9QJ24_9BACI|nr:LysE family translocator [Bacillus smithii]EHL78846.1 homoserine/Threonine efflux protein [Bacillus smithii 7_3_47FAA]